MFNKKYLILLFLTFHLTIGLKSTDFCILKQKKCKGYYDGLGNYHVNCDLIKCHGKLSYNCELNICSKNEHDCNEYNKLQTYKKILFETQSFTNIMSEKKYLKERNKIELFNENIHECANKTYEYESNDFCLNGRNCKIIFEYGYRKFVKKIDCKCPNKQSFKCGKYCTLDSNACDYYFKTNNESFIKQINDCENDNVSTLLRSNSIIW
jgi:hypothetical protein